MSFSAAGHTIRFLVFPIDLLQHNTRLWLACIALITSVVMCDLNPYTPPR